MNLQPGSRPVPNYPDYILIRKLGAGAFGEVWHAHGPGGLDVALKFIRVDAQGLARELRSLEAVKSVRHPNLVSLFGVWHKDNWLILAMELCDRTLENRLAEALCQDQPGIPPHELLKYMSDAASGLDALSAKQVLHRDVKPANLLLLNSGVKVADYGLAKVLEQTVASNSGAGTVAYLAPECFKGKLTQHSDQYSLAVTYYRLRTGHLLFEGNQAQMMYGHLELEPDLSHLAPREEAVLARALSKEPGKRWPNCKTFVNHLVNADQRGKVELQKDTARWYCNRGSVWLLNKDNDKAIANYNEAIRCDRNCVSAYNLRGLAWYYKKEFDKAIVDYDEAIRLCPLYAGFYNNRGNAWMDRNEIGKAMRDYGEAIRLDPKYADAFNNRGMACWSRKQYDKAIKDFEQAVRLDPNNHALYRDRGKFWLAKKEWDNAIKDFNMAIRLHPEADVLSHRGIAWIEKKDYEKAIDDFNEAACRDADNAASYWSRGIDWIERKPPIPIDPQTALFYYNRGDLWMEKTAFDKAINDFDEAIRIDPTYVFIDIGWRLSVLAAAYAEADQFEEAVCCQRKALEDPAYHGLSGDEYRRRLELYKQKKPCRQNA